MLGSEFGEIGERLRQSTVQIVDGSRGAGSGVICDQGGLVITNAHVIFRDRAGIQLWDGRRFAGQLLARDPRLDLAALRIDAADLPAVKVGDSTMVRAGELALAVGNPFGLPGALSIGVIHAVGPLPQMDDRWQDRRSHTWVQAALSLAPGNSGGPLADAQGRLIGINTMITSTGLALAIPSNTVIEFLGWRAQAA